MATAVLQELLAEAGKDGSGNGKAPRKVWRKHHSENQPGDPGRGRENPSLLSPVADAKIQNAVDGNNEDAAPEKCQVAIDVEEAPWQIGQKGLPHAKHQQEPEVQHHRRLTGKAAEPRPDRLGSAGLDARTSWYRGTLHRTKCCSVLYLTAISFVHWFVYAWQWYSILYHFDGRLSRVRVDSLPTSLSKTHKKTPSTAGRGKGCESVWPGRRGITSALSGRRGFAADVGDRMSAAFNAEMSVVRLWSAWWDERNERNDGMAG